MSKYKYITPQDAKLTPYNIADYIKTDEDMAMYLNAVLQDEDCTERDIQRALGDIAKIKGMTKTAKELNVGRESLYKTLDGSRDAYFSTIYKLLKSFGLTLKVERLSATEG